MPSILSPSLYVRRNPGKAFPVAMVIALAVTLVASVVIIVRSIDLTIYTLYGYNRYLTGLTPRNNIIVVPEEVEKVRKAEGLDRIVNAHSYQIQVKTIFGKMLFPLFGLDPQPRKRLMEMCGVRLTQGRMLEEGKPEALLSADIARNLGLKMGDVISKPESEDNFAPVPIRIVGLLEGKTWLGLVSRSFVDKSSPLTWSGYPQAQLDSAVEAVIDKSKARIWTFKGLTRETRSALSNLYLILNIVVGTIVVAISFVCGLLSNIFFTQRLPEIATLSAIGYPRAALLRRAVGETIYLCILGWIGGMCATVAFLKIVQRTLLEPRGLLIDPFDAQALIFTAPLPITIGIVAWITIGLRLSRLDPVSIIERRA
jgi:ABC-type lipoprotein release transport system permease subunit